MLPQLLNGVCLAHGGRGLDVSRHIGGITAAGRRVAETRICKTSRFARAAGRQEMINKPLGRACLYNRHMIEGVERFGLNNNRRPPNVVGGGT